MSKKGWQPPFNRERHESSGQYRMWRAMRGLKRFRHADIQTCAPGPTPYTIRSYVTALCRAGYLRREGKHSSPIYVLVRDTGPYAPQVRRDGRVYDLNRKRIYEEAHGPTTAPRLPETSAAGQPFDPNIRTARCGLGGEA